MNDRSSIRLAEATFEYLRDRLRSYSAILSQQIRRDLYARETEQALFQPSKFAVENIPLTDDYLDPGLLRFRFDQIEMSGLFDPAFYLEQLSQPISENPLEHYLRVGWTQAKDPNFLFSNRYYLHQYADVKASGIDPLTHYIERGSEEMRNPHPLFSESHFGSISNTMGRNSKTRLSHFLENSTSKHSPHIIFDMSEYSSRVEVAFTCARDALRHYIVSGWKSGIDFSPIFRAEHYRKQIGLQSFSVEPYTHYLIFGVPRSVDPHPLFDSIRYRQAAKDVGRNTDPVVHYLAKGERLGLRPNSLFDPLAYQALHAEKSFERGAFWHYLALGQSSSFNPISLFDIDKFRQTLLQHGNASSHVTVLESYLSQAEATLSWSQIEQLDTISVGQEVPSTSASRPNTPQAEAKAPQIIDREYPGKVPYAKGRPSVLLVAHAAAENLFGSERSFLDMAEALRALNVNLYIVLPRNVPDYTNRLRTICQHVFVFQYGWWRKDQPTSSEARDKFVRIIRDNKIDVVHANTIMLRECLEAARMMGIPGLVHVRELITHDVDLAALIGLSVPQIIESVKHRADWIVCNSKATAAAFHKPHLTKIVPNTTDITSDQFRYPDKGDKITFGLISSNIPKKGILDLVEVARLCKSQTLNAEFLMIGPETSSTLLLKGGLGTSTPDNLKFPGYAKTPNEAIAQCDVVLNLSHFAESFGRTVLEAMMCGRPVIAYDWGALGELIANDETGILVPYRDTNAVAAAVSQICDNPGLVRKLGENARAMALQRFSKSSYFDSFKELYFDVLPLAFNDVMPAPFVRAARSSNLARHHGPQKIAYFCWHFPVPSETFVLNELRVLSRQGYDVIVFCRQTPYRDFKPDFEICFERVDSADTLARRLLETSRTVVHAHFTYPTVTNMVWPACEQANIPFTFTAHAQDIFVYKNDELNRLADIGASALCLKMFTLSRFHRDFVVSRGFSESKVVINPNAIDAQTFVPSDRGVRWERSSKRVVAVHRFVPKKGLENLIKAGPLVSDIGVSIDIYGYGDLESDYRNIIENEHIKNVQIMGVLTQAEVAEVLKSADLFACPSIRTEQGDMDGIPTSVVESMASGVPVLTTSIAGISELVEDEVTGILCEPTPEAIAAAIRRFFSLTSVHVHAIAQAARRRALLKHDAVRTVRTMRRVWENDIVDIIIVSWNNLAELRMVIDAVQKNTALPYHLIVCDNMSRKEDVPRYLDLLWASNDRVTVIHNDKNAMVGPGTNAAIEKGNGEFIIYVCGKEGVSFENGWESAFIQEFNDERVGLVGTIGYSPTYLTGEQYPKGISLFDKFRNTKFAADNPDREFGHIQGGLFAMRRRMVNDIGGFSESVPHDYTDVEYSYYAESQGWKLGKAENVLALFNKSRPTLSQRMREDIKVAHPVLPQQVGTFKQLVAGALKHCNICDWFGSDFAPQSRRCPQCGSAPLDRTAYRWLSDSNFMYRRLPALAVGLPPAIGKVWKEQFQGPNLSGLEWAEILTEKGRLANGNNRLHLALFCCGEGAVIDFASSAREVSRLLKPGAPCVVHIESMEQSRWDEQSDALIRTFEKQDLLVNDTAMYSSAALGFSHTPLLVLRKIHVETK